MTLNVIPSEWRRLFLVTGGEGLQSGLHFALNLALIALLPARAYGAFAFVLVLGGVGIAYIRALAALPAATFIARARRPETADFFEGAFGAAALALSLAAAAGAGAALWAWGPDARVGGAAVVGLWSLRSHLRAVGFARGQAVAVTLGDAAFAASGVVASAFALWLDPDRLQGVLLSLALANVAGAAVVSLARGRAPAADFGARARRFYFRLAGRLAWSLYNVTATVLLGQGVAFLVVAAAGPAAFAPIAAMLAFFAPLRIFSLSLANMLQPEIAKLAAAGDELGWRRLRLDWTLRALVVALLYGDLSLAVIPKLHLQSLDGQPVLTLALSAWALYALVLGYIVPRVLLEARLKLRAVAAVTTIGALVGLSLTAGLLAVAEPAYAILGGLVGETAVALATWRLASKPLPARRRVYARAPAPSPLANRNLS